MSSSTRQRFLEKMETGQKITNPEVHLFQRYLSTETSSFFQSLNDSQNFPWDLSPVLFGEKLPQHSYLFDRDRLSKKKKTKLIAEHPSLQTLESICERIETDFDVTIQSVFCNRFQDAHHHIPWHTDTYGSHIFVLSLGASRLVQFRALRKTQDDTSSPVVSIHPQAGDLYFMPLWVNDTHEHRVCSLAEGNAESPSQSDSMSETTTETRISLVFFCEPPKYARKYRISVWDKMRGLATSMLE